MRYFSIIFVLCLTLSMVQAQQTSFVNPFIGTSDDHGQTDPSATIPFGMINRGQKLYLAETEVMIINHNS